MLRVIQAGVGRPISYPWDPNSIFQPGQIAELKLIGNDIVMGVSGGQAPIGIIDDVNTNAFSQSVIDEIVDIELSVIYDGYNWVSTTVAKQELRNSNIVSSSFVSTYDLGSGLSLNPINGMLTAPVGSIANYQLDDSLTPNAIRTVVRYAFYVPNLPGESSVAGSGKMTIWFTRGIFQTDQYEMVPYQVNATLFVSSRGNLTATRDRSDQPGVAICLVPPTAHNSMLEFMWM